MRDFPRKEKTYAVLAGAGKRAEDHENLYITAKDAEELRNALLQSCLFIPEKCSLFVNGDATVNNLRIELERIAGLTKDEPAELVIIYFSGHGLVAKGIPYLICNDTINSDINASAMLGSELVALLQKINTEKMLVLLDCCHAQAVTTSVAIPFDQNSFLAQPNRLILSGSHKEEVSYLSRPVSIFTFAVIEALRGKYFMQADKDVKVFDLAMYVRERVVLLSEQHQHPQLHVMKNGMTTNFTLARHPNGKMPTHFPVSFELIHDDKAIDLSRNVQRDEKYRNYFQWINTINIHADGGVGIVNGSGHTITINNQSTPGELAEVVEILKQMSLQWGLIELLRAESKQDTNLLALKIEKLALKDIVLIKTNSLIFIGRDEVKSKLVKMLTEKTEDLMFLDGKPQSGLSYLGDLLSHISDKYKFFDFRPINIQKISKDEKHRMVEPIHIAKAIASKIGMSVDWGEFKQQHFFNDLRNKLAEILAHSNRKCLLFFDQFDVLLSDEVPAFMEELSAMVVDENAETFMIIAGYKQAQKFSKKLKRISPTIHIDSHFNKEIVQSFLEKVYMHPEVSFYKKMNKPTFFASTESYLPDALFEEGAVNVKEVGDALDEWYWNIRNQIEI